MCRRGWGIDVVPKVQMCGGYQGGGAGVGVALAPTHTCRRLLGKVELEPLHLGDEVAAAPGGRGISVDRPTQGVGREARGQGHHAMRGGRRGAASPLGVIRRGRTGRGHGTAQAQAGL